MVAVLVIVVLLVVVVLVFVEVVAAAAGAGAGAQLVCPSGLPTYLENVSDEAYHCSFSRSLGE